MLQRVLHRSLVFFLLPVYINLKAVRHLDFQLSLAKAVGTDAGVQNQELVFTVLVLFGQMKNTGRVGTQKQGTFLIAV